MTMDGHLALNSYNSLDAYGRVEHADGHELIRLLLDTLSVRIVEAKNCIEEENINEKIVRLTKALNILDGLRMALNQEEGGEIAVNLDDLYDYMQRRLVHANAHNDVSTLLEIKGLVDEIKEAWIQIPLEVRR